MNKEQTDTSVDQHRRAAPSQLRFSVLTISDTRTLANDRSGEFLIEAMEKAGHHLIDRRIVPDEPVEIAKNVKDLAASHRSNVLLLTGGTGISPRDRTPEAVSPLFEMEIPGFGELFRMLSYEEIGPAAMLSRAMAGRIANCLVFCLPGSTNAVRLATEKLLIPELPHLVHHSQTA